MGKTTGISWADATVNFETGCTKVSAGCKYCYMFRDMARWNKDGSVVQRTSPGTFNAALKWKQPEVIFTDSWSDFFHDGTADWMEEKWDVIRKTPQHLWLILTKRPENILKYLPADWGEGYPNVAIGVSVENQENANTRIPLLCAVPAKYRFLSCEPLLEEIDLKLREHYLKIDWVIVGGESGNETGQYRYRPTEYEWIVSTVLQCMAMSVRVFVKQLGTYLAKEWKLKDRAGADIDEWPQNIRVQEHIKDSFFNQSEHNG